MRDLKATGREKFGKLFYLPRRVRKRMLGAFARP
jgi:hypothetical protein